MNLRLFSQGPEHGVACGRPQAPQAADRGAGEGSAKAAEVAPASAAPRMRLRQSSPEEKEPREFLFLAKLEVPEKRCGKQ